MSMLKMTLQETIKISTFIWVEIALKWLFSPQETNATILALDRQYLPLNWADFTLQCLAILLFWGMLICITKRTLPETTPHRWIWISWVFFPIAFGDIFAGASVVLLTAWEASRNNLNIKKIYSLITSGLGAIAILTMAYAVLKPSTIDLIHWETIMVVSLIGLEKEDIKISSLKSLLPAILFFTLSCALYRHNIPGYFLNHIPESIMVILILILEKKYRSHPHLRRANACLMTACAYAVNIQMGLLVTSLLCINSIGQLLPENKLSRAKEWFSILLRVNILMLSGWSFAQADAALYPKIFIVYAAVFSLFFITPPGWLAALGQSAAIIFAPAILMVDKLYWAAIPCAFALIYAQAQNKPLKKIRTAAKIIPLVSAIILLIIL